MVWKGGRRSSTSDSSSVRFDSIIIVAHERFLHSHLLHTRTHTGYCSRLFVVSRDGALAVGVRVVLERVALGLIVVHVSVPFHIRVEFSIGGFHVGGSVVSLSALLCGSSAFSVLEKVVVGGPSGAAIGL